MNIFTNMNNVVENWNSDQWRQVTHLTVLLVQGLKHLQVVHCDPLRQWLVAQFYLTECWDGSRRVSKELLVLLLVVPKWAVLYTVKSICTSVQCLESTRKPFSLHYTVLYHTSVVCLELYYVFILTEIYQGEFYTMIFIYNKSCISINSTWYQQLLWSYLVSNDWRTTSIF